MRMSAVEVQSLVNMLSLAVGKNTAMQNSISVEENVGNSLLSSNRQIKNLIFTFTISQIYSTSFT
jgi:hypothetical protein